ncbi:hypothetical protein SAMD00019534_046980 [Acytostelium subglobosum LB1]|uniref:hypothetical protein n=1 Tax=Acytostelium subglobosum LB1 TaxID=1410327 RepID=UPI000644BEF5|nr:hypothetical protein SAMD00019534_046980 [Acytostelium subglobosum LB1]GAM21523.1 hypothetical protein SAMD00019534_046980 [Acytostelium subglobosum LB1]|eukprot:XP_012755642.1 hypothetical protein SAMD00019534_046980 [Acytostelium subglobosum LB1]
MRDVMPTAISIMSHLLRIPTREGPLRLNKGIYDLKNGQCGDGNGIYIHRHYIDEGIEDADLLLYLTARPFPKVDTMAFGMPCNFDYDTTSYKRTIFGRPLAGYINLNPNQMNNFANTSSQYTFEKAVVVTLHEMIHVMGFTPNLYSSYLDRDGNPHEQPIIHSKSYGVNPSNVTSYQNSSKISTPQVTRAARTFYDCPECDGMELEMGCNDTIRNTANPNMICAHWESRVAYSEIMTSQDSPDMVISVLTLALLQDMGWYLVDTNMVQQMHWGHGQGCQFLENRCESWYKGKQRGLFCTEPKGKQNTTWLKNYSYCTHDAKAIGFCNLKYYGNEYIPDYYQHFADPTLGGPKNTDYCPFIQTDGEHNLCEAQLGDVNAKCFMLTNTRQNQTVPKCFNTRCTPGGVLQIKVDNCYFDCPLEGGEIQRTGAQGNWTLQCPPNVLCRQSNLDMLMVRGSLNIDDPPFWKSYKFYIPMSVAGVILIASCIGGFIFYTKVLAKRHISSVHADTELKTIKQQQH